MSEPALDVSLTADGERATGEGVCGVSSSAPLATTKSTKPLAFCRMLIACWWLIFESNGCPSIASIWSPSRRFPSLEEKKGKETKLINKVSLTKYMKTNAFLILFRCKDKSVSLCML